MKPFCMLLWLFGLLAVPEAEGGAFPISTFNCRQNGSACAGGGSIEQLPEVNGLSGIKMWVNQPQTYVTCGFEDCLEELSLVELNVIGQFAGTYEVGQLIPFSWDFTIDYRGPGQVNRWEISAGIYNGIAAYTAINESGTNIGHITGTANLTSFGFTDGMGLLITSQVRVYWQGPAGDSLTITVPGNSMDFGVAPTAGVPEPGTAGFLVGGLLVAGWMRRGR